MAEKKQQLSIKRIRAERPPVLGFPGYDNSREATELDSAATFLYGDLPMATSVHDIVRAYKMSKIHIHQKDNLTLLARRILEENLWRTYEEFERLMQEFCVATPSDREEFVRFLGIENE